MSFELSPFAILAGCVGLFTITVFVGSCWTGAAPPPPPTARARRAMIGVRLFHAVGMFIGLMLIGGYVFYFHEAGHGQCVRIGQSWVQGGNCK